MNDDYLFSLEKTIYEFQFRFKNFLDQIANKNLNSPVFIIYGPPSSGKKLLTFFWIKSLLCNNVKNNNIFFCNQCQLCHNLGEWIASDFYFSGDRSFLKYCYILTEIFKKFPNKNLLDFVLKSWNFFLFYLAQFYIEANENLSIDDPILVKLKDYRNSLNSFKKEKKRQEILNKKDNSFINFLKDFYSFFEKKNLNKFLKKDFTIHSARKIINDLYKSSLYGNKKIWLINEVENLRKETITLLLKTLEEPPENTYIILISNNLNKVLPTLRSRTTLIPFTPLTESLKKTLIENLIVGPFNFEKLNLQRPFWNILEEFLLIENISNQFKKFIEAFPFIEKGDKSRFFIISLIGEITKKDDFSFLQKKVFPQFLDLWIEFFEYIEYLKHKEFYYGTDYLEAKFHIDINSKVIDYYKNFSFILLEKIKEKIIFYKKEQEIFNMNEEQNFLTLVFDTFKLVKKLKIRLIKS